MNMEFVNYLARVAARTVFKKRGNHSEAHLTEDELMVIVSAAIRLYEERRTPGIATQPSAREHPVEQNERYF
jgi:hypothetical protein